MSDYNDGWEDGYEKAQLELDRLRKELAAGNEWLNARASVLEELALVRAENEKLRAELHDANEALTVAYLQWYSKASEQARAAATALKETEDE